jgi:hypothetical protein
VHVEESVEQRQRNGRRLAGTRLGQTEYVTTPEAGGNRFELDRPRSVETSGTDTVHESVVQVEPVESGPSHGC